MAQEVYADKLNPGETNKTIDISSFAKGIYTISVESEKGRAFKKLIIN